MPNLHLHERKQSRKVDTRNFLWQTNLCVGFYQIATHVNALGDTTSIATVHYLYAWVQHLTALAGLGAL